MDHKTRAGWATTFFAITLGVLLSIGLGVAYSNLAMNYHYELQNDARPVIQPTSAPSPAGQMQRVLMIVIEGGRFDALSNPAVAPNITNFAAMGTQLGNCHAQFPTVTKTAVGTIYTGAAPFTQPYLMNTQTTPAQMPCETLFKVACRQPSGATALCGDPQWAELFAPYVNASYVDLADFLSQYVIAPPL
ncbi:MAG TPA: alkaline phosphatase family protein, partial [Candidatus Lokiarchaeia archaeon]|nr:alkaline phosphatase family protein [Candidatus Lokiarchaeia archaeon]